MPNYQVVYHLINKDNVAGGIVAGSSPEEVLKLVTASSVFTKDDPYIIVSKATNSATALLKTAIVKITVGNSAE